MPQQLSPQAILKQLLAAQAVSTQEEIRERLKERGISITQSQISRLLRKMGAIKTSNDQGEMVYSLGLEEASVPSLTSMSQMIVDMVANENLIVLHTSPGSAPLIGGLLDHHAKELGVLGTVAGDDTLFVAPLSIGQIEETKKAIADLLGL